MIKPNATGVGPLLSQETASPAAPSPSPNRLLRLLPLYIGFAATGISVALPGAVLPVLLKRWHLHDEGGGRLFLGAFIGSSLGALLVSRSRRRSLSLGSGLIAAAAVSLTLTSASLAPLCMTLLGMGLGMTMTSISLVRQQQARNSSAEMVRLNLLWSIGAFACPALALGALRSENLRPVLFSLALIFVLLMAWALLQPASHFGRAPSYSIPAPAFATLRKTRLTNYFQDLPLRLVLLVMLTTGVEASFGGWLSTYAQRGGGSFSQIVAAPTCFWAGLLLSRLFWSLHAPRIAESWTVRGSLLLIAASGLLLLDLHHGLPFLCAALCIGFGIGPTYPLLLARVLRVRPTGTIFFLCGASSACLPWLTGVVSTRFESLHTGLLVPVMAAVAMVAMSFTLALAADPTS